MKFSCPVCNNPIPFRFVSKVANNHIIKCPTCHTDLIPEKSKSWAWGAIIGFISVVLPAQLYLMTYGDIVKAILVGIGTGSVGIACIAMFVYNSTVFKKT